MEENKGHLGTPLDPTERIFPPGAVKEKSWPEDLTHENGNYLCKCVLCGDMFQGHKRRPLCKLCAEGIPRNAIRFDQLHPEVEKFLSDHATIIDISDHNERWYLMPYWLLRKPDGTWYMITFENLPQHLKDYIIKHRE